MTCSTCESRATIVFNDGKLACDACKEARFEDRARAESENDLWWALANQNPNVAA
jgi:hypothetical protein